MLGFFNIISSQAHFFRLKFLGKLEIAMITLEYFQSEVLLNQYKIAILKFHI